MYRLLIVEDDRDVCANIAEYFEVLDYELDFAYDGKTALNLIASSTPDMIILDIGLPSLDGNAVGASLRASGCDIPILVLTARDTLEDKEAAFDNGADDYLVKPFALRELELRTKALLRRSVTQGHRTVLAVADLRFDTGTHQVTRGGKVLQLSRTQQKTLRKLMQDSPNVVTKASLTSALWGDDPPGKSFDQPLIHTEHGQGYALRALNND